MYPTSDRFKAALKTSHKIATACKVFDPTGMYVQDLDLIDGNLTLDDSASTRWAATFTLTDNTGTLAPGTAHDLLAPRGTEVQVYRGIEFPDKTKELIPLGRYRLSSLSIDDSGQGMHIEIQAYDRSRAVALNRFKSNGFIAKGTLFTDALSAIISISVPQAAQSFTSVNFTTPLITYNIGDDPWALCRSIADSIGCELFFDEIGNAILQPVTPDIAYDDPDFSYVEGQDCTMMYVNKHIDDENSYSHVVVTGESNDASSNGVIYTGEALDLDPNSPTYFETFGDVPFFFSSPLYTSNAQCAASAQKFLAQKVGLAERLQLLNIVDPSIRLNDKVYVKRKASNIDATYTVSKLTFPMVHDRGMNVSTTERRLLS